MELYANVIGEGRPFLILHGFLGMSDNWKTLGKHFSAEGYQVHLIDQRNHGRSFHSDVFSYKVMAEDVKMYCDANDLSDVVLLGHSMGGKVAMQLGVIYPELINKLIIADIGPKYYPLHHQDILDGLQSLDFETLQTRGAVDKELSSYVSDPGVRMFLMKNLYWKEKGRLGLRINLDALVKNVSEIGKPLDENEQYKQEVLFLKGDRSNYIQERDKENILKQFPAAVFGEISNAGHWLHAENPKEFMVNVLKFVKN
ncbi:alpha/beta fold hydrolase [Aquimarina hainanensis]|uniref:Alpha/beta fold hydrolase n=1 Tax=Aquimarina hainanensis TaxID=1578017 RepID=A0ABW5N574_9FLAO